MNHNYQVSSLPLSVFTQLNCPCRCLLVAENKMNFLTLPPMPKSIGIWSGGGFNISYFKNIPWLSGVQSYYRGDLDAQGLQILNQFRTYYPSAVSFLMNKETLHTYRHLMKEGIPLRPAVAPPHRRRAIALPLPSRKQSSY